ncbi:hypothetical protein FQN49_001188 [Arthroderma sp. PD_2]|nr:hypothetical protein FQN49_001188 [Arthroderma sp. PD_2]
MAPSALSTIARDRLDTVSRHIMTPSFFTTSAVPKAPEDPLFGLAAACRADTSDKKIDLGIGAYRDSNAKPWVLPVVKKADQLLRDDPTLNHEYLPIAGLKDFTTAAQKLILGEDSPAIRDKRVVTFQTISGTGAVHLGGLFIAKFFPSTPKPTIYLSNPTWPNHPQIFNTVHLESAYYPYFNPATKGLNLEGMLKSIRAAPTGSVILLHPCAHNPTGVDPTQHQWKQIATVIRERNHFPFFDCAYQGFASGDLARDSWAVRYFIAEGFEMCISQSFAKNFGLYGERAGAFHFITAPGPNAAEALSNVASQLAILQRSEISNPPAYGARIASTILNDPVLFKEWEQDLHTMSGRIVEMRQGVRDRLEQMGTPGTWDHITNQIGMFSFTGLTEQQVQILREKWHIYMTKNGRISMAGLNVNNIDYFAEAVDAVVRETTK